MRLSRRHVTPVLFATALATGASAVAAAGAGAAGVAVSGDDGRPVAISPGSPPALRNLRPQAVVTPDPGTRYSVTVTGPDGRPAAAPVTCADGAQPSTLQVAYRGNGAYGVALTHLRRDRHRLRRPARPADDLPVHDRRQSRARPESAASCCATPAARRAERCRCRSTPTPARSRARSASS